MGCFRPKSSSGLSTFADGATLSPLVGALNKFFYQIIISGHVQGIGFRAHIKERATALHLKGLTRNLPTGEVEILTHASGEEIKILIEKLKENFPHSIQETTIHLIDSFKVSP
jgi:acylphosphatase